MMHSRYSKPLLAVSLFILLVANQATSGVRPATHLYGVSHYNNHLYAAGSSHRIFQKDSGGEWVLVEEGLEKPSWTGMAAGDGKLVTVGGAGEIGISEDGENWQIVEEAVGGSVWQVVYEAGYFWAVGDEGRLYRSADALDWHRLETGSAGNLRGMAFDGSIFVVVGEGGTLLTSSDGVAWTQQSIDSSWNIRDIVVGSEGFVAVARGDASMVLRSADGVSWTSSDLSGSLVWAVAFGDGRYVIAAGSGGSLATFVSEDAETWIQSEVPLATTLTRLIFDGERFVAAGLYGSVVASADGMNWEVLRSELESSLWGIAEDSDGNQLVVGESGLIRQRGEQGQWRSMASRSSAWLWDVVSVGGVSMAVGDSGRILRSEDGGQWNLVRNPEGDDSIDPDAASDESNAATLRAVAHGMGKFIAVGDDGIVLISGDGYEWKSELLPVSEAFWSIAYGEGVFVAVGENGAAAISEDGGETWAVLPVAVTTSLYSATFHEGSGFSIMGSNRFLAHSTNGTDWEVVPSEDEPVQGIEMKWHASASGTGWIVALGEEMVWGGMAGLELIARERIIEISPDGMNWERLDYAAADHLHGIVIGPRGATAVGISGRIVQFPLPPLVANQSADMTLMPGSEASFWAEPGGTPPFEVSWFKDGEELLVQSGETYTISNVSRSDIGGYRAGLRNDAGFIQSQSIFLTVLTSYEDWRHRHEGHFIDGNDSPESAPFATGVPNLIAYFLDQPPGISRNELPSAGIQSVVAAGGADDFLTLTFSRAIGAEDLRHSVEGSWDLLDWQPLSDENVIALERDGSRERVTVRDDEPVRNSGASRFLRLRVDLLDGDR